MATGGEGFGTERARLTQGGFLGPTLQLVENIKPIFIHFTHFTSQLALRLGPSAAWAFGMQEVEVIGEQIWLLGAKALAQNVQD